MKLNVLFKNLAFIKIEFDILQPKLGICSYLKDNPRYHVCIWEVDSHIDLNMENIMKNCLIIRTKKGYHFYFPKVLEQDVYFTFLFEMTKKGLCDPDFFFYSFKRGFSTLRISGKDLKVIQYPSRYQDYLTLQQYLKRMPVIKYYKRKYDFMSKKFLLGKEWYDIRIPINDL